MSFPPVRMYVPGYVGSLIAQAPLKQIEQLEIKELTTDQAETNDEPEGETSSS